jgi:hypothetical protein
MHTVDLELSNTRPTFGPAVTLPPAEEVTSETAAALAKRVMEGGIAVDADGSLREVVSLPKNRLSVIASLAAAETLCSRIVAAVILREGQMPEEERARLETINDRLVKMICTLVRSQMCAPRIDKRGMLFAEN